MKRMIPIIGLFMILRSAATPWVPPIGIPDPRWSDTLHPITTLKPNPPLKWPTESVVGYYYIDSGHPTATDTSNIYGYPDRPRRTIPTTLAAGSKVFLARCATAWTTYAASGTISNPIWIIGTGAALWKPTGGGITMRIRGNSTFVIVDGIVMDGADTTASDAPAAWSVQYGPNHICIRNCTSRNYPPPPWSDAKQGAAFFMANGSVGSSSQGGVSHVVIHNLKCVGNGGGQFLSYESGQHCIVIAGTSSAYSTNNVWVIDCDLSEGSEDGLQIGTTSGGVPQSSCDSIYIGRNSIKNNRENAIDIKCSNRVVMSKNVFSGYSTTVGSLSSDGAAGVINNDGGGPAQSWWLFNRIFDCHLGIRNQAAGGNHYLIGNIVSDMHLESGDAPASPGKGQGSFYLHDSASNVYITNNTVYDVEMGININNVSKAFVWGNIISNIRNNGVGYPIYIKSSTSISVGDNVYFDPESPVRRHPAAMSVVNGDMIDINPEFINPPVDMGLSSKSPGINSAFETSPYAVYDTNFNQSIRFDFNGEPRPMGKPWNSGAIQSREMRILPPVIKTPEIIK